MSEIFDHSQQGKVCRIVTNVEAITSNYISGAAHEWSWETLMQGEIIVDLGLRIDCAYNDHLCLTTKGLFFIEDYDFFSELMVALIK